MPREAAESLPKVNASSARRCHRHTASPTTATGTANHTDGQRTPLRLPSSQNIMPRACSELADLVIRNAVRALNNCEPAMPARIICPVPLDDPLARASRVTSAKAAIAPTNAPADNDTRPPPTPIKATSTAPVDAPALMPSRYGSASGLRSSDCRITPHVANPAPQAAATNARVRR